MKAKLLFCIVAAIAVMITFCSNPTKNQEKETRKSRPYNAELIEVKTKMMTHPYLMHSNCYKKGDFYVSEPLFADGEVEKVFNVIELNIGSTVEVVVNNDYWLVNVFEYFDKQPGGIEESQWLDVKDNFFIKNGKRIKNIKCVGDKGFMYWDFDFTNPEKQNFIYYYKGSDEWKVLEGNQKKSFAKWADEAIKLQEQYAAEVQRLREKFNKIK